MIKLSHIGSLSILTLTAVFGYSGCASVDTDEDATSDEESIGESESELGTADLAAANACVKAINDYRTSHGKTNATNLNSTLTSTPLVSGNTYGDCAQKEAKYDSVNGAHASFNYSQLGKYQCRALGIDVLGRPKCAGPMKLVAMITDPTSAARYLRGIGELPSVPERSPSRGPPYWKSTVLRRKALGYGGEDTAS